MKKQPDFAKLFRKHFGGKPSKVKYQIRSDSNRFHDLVFLSSLIHDARFKRKETIIRNSRLKIPIERDCWELGIVDHPDCGELHICQAHLSISPVHDIEWRFENETKFSSGTELWIENIWLQRQELRADDTMPIVINGFSWECVLTVHEPRLKIQLQDLEKPYLQSKRKKNRSKH